tara:strand:- start:27726 stop:28571 length:846 start_codon:yes stop_codon:yes gene_type:complete
VKYVLFYIGDVPEYVTYCIKNIIKVDTEAEIYFCSDKDLKIKDINFLHVDDFESDYTTTIKDMDLFNSTNYEGNNLWLSSILRVFYLLNVAKEFNFNSFVHFDCDVIIFKPFSALSSVFLDDKINITQLTTSELIFSYSYISGLSNFETVCNSLYQKVKRNSLNDSSYIPANEMILLGELYKDNPEFFNIIPSLPYSDSDIIFDPATYGQYLGGTDLKPNKKFTKKIAPQHHLVGSEITSKRIKPFIKNRLPFVECESKIYQLANLHVHSKDLKKFSVFRS